MKKIILLTLSFISFTATSQSWIWTKKFQAPQITGAERLVATNNKVYSYRSAADAYYYSNPENDTEGSYLRTYSQNGDALAEKHWAMPFHLRQLVTANDSGFFFVGSFWGQRSIDNINFSSAGKADGVFGKMRFTGEIEWLHTFGGSLDDFGTVITYDATHDLLSVGGSITDTLNIDHSYITSAKKSALILQYNAAGQFSRYKLFDFTIAADSFDYPNCVASLEHNSNGNLVMLMDRNGQYWYTYPYTHAIMGRYLIKLDQNLDTLWTKYVIGPSCYYGWNCTDLQVSANNDIYVAPTCGGHHSSEAHIQRYDGTTGSLKWQFNYPDGSYTDIFVDSTTLYVIGNEGANMCACEGENPGYYVIKQYDHTDNLKGETRVSEVYLYRLTGDHHGNLYTGGNFYGSVRMGPDTFPATTGVYQWTPTLSRLSAVSCTVPSINVPPKMYPYMPDYIMCVGDSVQLTANNGSGTFSWTNGLSGTSTWVYHGGPYYLINSQPDGCTAYSLPVYVFENNKAQPHYPYLATFDTPKSRWTVIAGQSGEYEGDCRIINLHKLTHNGWVKVASTSNASLYGFTALSDSTTDPNSGPATYCFSSEDTCGNISPLGSSITTVFLSAHRNTFTGANELQWTSYKRMSRDYILLRGDSPDHLQKIATLDTSQHVYVDYADGTNFYQVIVETNTVQVPDGVYADAHSNIAQVLKTTSIAKDLAEAGISVAPNPFTDEITLTSHGEEKNIRVRVLNSLGEVVLAEQTTTAQSIKLNLSDKSSGLYTLEVFSNEKKLRYKLIKN